MMNRLLDINKIDLSKLAKELPRYESKWIAVSENNEIVASGDSYTGTMSEVRNEGPVILLKVPPVDASLAPYA
jgi:hypothetical protein